MCASLISLLFISVSCDKDTGCPPETPYLFDRAIEIDLEPDSWYYFLTSRPIDPNESLFFEIRTEKPVKLYVGREMNCPNASEQPAAEIDGGNKTVKIRIDHQGRQFFGNGIYSAEGTKLQLKLLGQEAKAPKTKSSRLLPFIVGVVISFVCFFVDKIAAALEARKPKQD